MAGVSRIGSRIRYQYPDPDPNGQHTGLMAALIVIVNVNSINPLIFFRKIFLFIEWFVFFLYIL